MSFIGTNLGRIRTAVRLMDRGYGCRIAAEQDLRILQLLDNTDKKGCHGPGHAGPGVHIPQNGSSFLLMATVSSRAIFSSSLRSMSGNCL